MRKIADELFMCVFFAAMSGGAASIVAGIAYFITKYDVIAANAMTIVDKF